MKGESCAGLGCTRKISNIIKWPDAQIEVPVCPEHLVAFSTSQMVVTSEVVPEWRRPDRAPAILTSMLDQAEAALTDGKIPEAVEAIKLALSHIQNCKAHHIELDTVRYADIVLRVSERVDPEEG